MSILPILKYHYKHYKLTTYICDCILTKYIRIPHVYRIIITYMILFYCYYNKRNHFNSISYVHKDVPNVMFVKVITRQFKIQRAFKVPINIK